MSAVALILVSVALVLAATREPQPSHVERLQRGQYLVEFGGCADCHTPQQMTPEGPRPDRSRWLSGHPENVQLPPPPKLPEGPWLAIIAGLTGWAI